MPNEEQASDITDDEQWADIFANYVAGNINLGRLEGRDMYRFVTNVLSPYIGLP